MDISLPLERLRQRFEKVVADLGNPDIIGNPGLLQELQREHARLDPVVTKFELFRRKTNELEGLKALLNGSDAEMRGLAAEEIPGLEQELQQLSGELQLSLLPPDPNEDRNIILEIRAGTGGDEAGLFAAELLRMYTRYAEKRSMRIEPIDASLSDRGGLKEAIMQVSGSAVWNHFKFERGVHRVQRVPATEANGRVHTSTATVAVLPEAEEVDIKIDPSDLRIDTFRASGAGGQHINKTDSAVRITHIPTGFAVACQEERSQIKNRAKAMSLLRSRLLEMQQEKQAQEMSKDRKNQVGTGERSEKIRTYNFPQDRVTDHRINMSFHNIPAIMQGDLEPVIAALQKDDQIRRLSEITGMQNE